MKQHIIYTEDHGEEVKLSIKGYKVYALMNKETQEFSFKKPDGSEFHPRQVVRGIFEGYLTGETPSQAALVS